MTKRPLEITYQMPIPDETEISDQEDFVSPFLTIYLKKKNHFTSNLAEWMVSISLLEEKFVPLPEHRIYRDMYTSQMQELGVPLDAYSPLLLDMIAATLKTLVEVRVITARTARKGVILENWERAHTKGAGVTWTLSLEILPKVN